MPAVLNTNMASLYAQKNLSTAQADLATSVQRLSSGKRINSAKDDAAGFAVAEAVAATKNITDQSIRNTQDAISLVQTAEGALDVVGKILQRVLTLTTQKEDGSLSSGQTTSMNSEIDTLLGEISQIRDRTRFQGNSASIFGTSATAATTFTFTTGSGTSSPTQTVVTIGALSTTSLSKLATETATATSSSTTLSVSALDVAVAAGSKIFINGVDSTKTVTADASAGATSVTIQALEVTSGDIVTFYSPSAISSSSSSSKLMSAIQQNASERAALGAKLGQLNYIVDNMQTLSNNLADAKSRIIDTDYAAETAALTRGQILQQAATSMLAQANQMPNVILTLLK